MAYEAYVFDAYGTLFDVASAVRRHGQAIGTDAARLGELWRTKQIEYSWVRSLMRRRKDFWSLTEDALDYAIAELGGGSAGLRRQLLDAYEDLDAYPDVASTLQALKARGERTAILSNGTAAMLARALASAGLTQHIDHVLSVDEVDAFKTDPKTYQLVVDRLDLAPGRVAFVSSNRWDIAGATAFGFTTFWINRSGKTDEYLDLPPLKTLSSLGELIGS